MGLNLETLIGILVVLILLILADGIRRMVRDRSGRLKVRIDPRVKDLPDIIEAPNRELIGGPRTVNRDGSASRAPSQKVTNSSAAGKPEQHTSPPVVMEAEPTKVSAATTAATQPDLFGASAEKAPDKHVESAVESKRERRPEAVKPRQEPVADKQEASKPAREDILEVIVLHMVAHKGVTIPGRDLLQHLLEQGMRFGEMNIFHRHSQVSGGEDELLFSMANALEPGTFDIDTMEENTFRAATFFMKLPGPSKPLASLDKMLSVIRQLAERCDAELRDEQHSVLTPQTIEHLRQRVQDFERRQRINNV
ncbi:MAG: cell division protein ZipA [Gammaproteobacteria bacterium]|jgi:cell division protein ZipA|nr:cell division protein ZipA [Gammaproteobacteria bacterium]MBQ0773577.1 cell division protein ZipA [Gammaproteobacteria bacterium]|tara:strand:+ start:150511 stop:151437 length:927 start_codon:yes stop_codon:yes gene_type:complete